MGFWEQVQEAAGSAGSIEKQPRARAAVVAAFAQEEGLPQNRRLGLGPMKSVCSYRGTRKGAAPFCLLRSTAFLGIGALQPPLGCRTFKPKQLLCAGTISRHLPDPPTAGIPCHLLGTPFIGRRLCAGPVPELLRFSLPDPHNGLPDRGGASIILPIFQAKEPAGASRPRWWVVGGSVCSLSGSHKAAV